MFNDSDLRQGGGLCPKRNDCEVLDLSNVRQRALVHSEGFPFKSKMRAIQHLVLSGGDTSHAFAVGNAPQPVFGVIDGYILNGAGGGIANEYFKGQDLSFLPEQTAKR